MAGIEIFALYRCCDLDCCDLDLDPMIFIYERDPYSLKMYRQTDQKRTFYVKAFDIQTYSH